MAAAASWLLLSLCHPLLGSSRVPPPPSGADPSPPLSTIFTREVSGSHKLTIDGWSASRKIPHLSHLATSQPFEAAGYTWQIRYGPNGPNEGGHDDDFISLYLELAHGYGEHHQLRNQKNHVPVQFESPTSPGRRSTPTGGCWRRDRRCSIEAELQALTSSKKDKEKEKESSGAARRVMKIKGMEPKVFKAMLHFVYTDALPQELEQDGDGDGVEMARGLLAAAHRYKLERLKLMCEEALCRRIDVETVAAILVAAEEHGCQALKAACVEFMARPGFLKAVIQTRGFEEMKATCLPLLVELLVKQLA